MKVKYLYISGFLLLLLGACHKENYIRINHSDAILALWPEIKTQQRFMTGNISGPRDTIYLKTISKTSKYNTQPFEGTTSKYLGDVDQIEIQQSKYILGLDTPFNLLIIFDFSSEYDPSHPTFGKDKLQISVENDNGLISNIFEFSYTDSLRFEGSQSFIGDTLVVDSLDIFTNYLINDTSGTGLIYSPSEGILGFKSPMGKQFYQL